MVDSKRKGDPCPKLSSSSGYYKPDEFSRIDIFYALSSSMGTEDEQKLKLSTDDNTKWRVLVFNLDFSIILFAYGSKGFWFETCPVYGYIYWPICSYISFFILYVPLVLTFLCPYNGVKTY